MVFTSSSTDVLGKKCISYGLFYSQLYPQKAFFMVLLNGIKETSSLCLVMLSENNADGTKPFFKMHMASHRDKRDLVPGGVFLF